MNLYKFHANPEELDFHDEAHEKVPFLIWEKYKENPAELKKQEDTIAKDAKYSYLYALCILNKPFIIGEQVVCKDTKYAYRYTRDVLKAPWPKGEDAIAKDSYYSYYYAYEVLKGRFPKGEDAIAKCANYSYYYAKDILKLSEKEAEGWAAGKLKL